MRNNGTLICLRHAASGPLECPYERGWGAAADFPGIVLDNNGPRVDGYLFLSANLSAHWPMLDAFEEGYDRVAVDVTTEDGQRVTAWIYQLQPKVAA